MSKTAFVLSGGGAKGAFQAGVMWQLVKSGIIPDAIYGASVGSINAAAYAYSNEDEVVNHWLSVKGKGDALSFNWSTLLGISDGFYSLDPLNKNFLSKVLVGQPHTEAVATLCNLSTGAVEYCSNMKTDLATFARRVMGSGAIPMIMSPVDGYIDGGAREQVPVRKAIADGYTNIYVISCNPWVTNPMDPYTPTSFLKFFLRFYYVMLRAVSTIMEHGTYYSNIQYPVQEALLANRTSVDPIKITLYAPAEPLYDTLTFDPKLIAAAVDMGKTIQPLDLSQYFQI